MTNIFDFKINRAEAEYSNGNLTVRLFYPRNPEILTQRIPEDIDFGIYTLETLLSKGKCELTDSTHAFKTPSGGSLYFLSDGKFVCHRRDIKAPTHKLYHSSYGGFAQSETELMTEQGLNELALRETAEESLLLTRGRDMRLVVPTDSVHYTQQSAKKLGLNIDTLLVDVTTLPSTDRLEVFYEDGTPLFSINTFLGIMFESGTTMCVYQVRNVPLSSEEVFPLDAEGMDKDDKYIHFNRESFMIHPHEIQNKPFGTTLECIAWQTRIADGKPMFYNPTFESPYYGPEGVQVKHPLLWAPENMLCDILDVCKVPGFSGKRIELELEKLRGKKAGKNPIVNEEFLVR